jgi:hypothetical protein
MNEHDYILDFEIRPKERIEENAYEKFKGNFYKIIKTQNGSRVLQKVLKNTPKNIISKIFVEIKCYLNDLIIDSYANYFVQKFFSQLNIDERLEFLEEVKISIKILIFI